MLNKQQAERLMKIRDLMRQVHAHFMGEWADLRRRRLEMRKRLQERLDKRRADEVLASLRDTNSQPQG